jgi:hypothetical protein
MSTNKIPSGPCALESFRAKGWSYRTAAGYLRVSSTHLFQVLNGNRHSRRLLTRVAALPVRKEMEA